MDPIDRIPIKTVAPSIWLATPEGLVSIDTVAVERVINGDRTICLTRDEARYAAKLMADHGVSYPVIAARLGVCTMTVQRWLRVKRTSTRPGERAHRTCGTLSGYHRHRRHKKKICSACRAAQARPAEEVRQ